LEGKETGKGEVLIRGRLKLGEVERYLRTFSTVVRLIIRRRRIRIRRRGRRGEIGIWWMSCLIR
jgi:hypothetical protein